jgi:hypothetical protein
MVELFHLLPLAHFTSSSLTTIKIVNEIFCCQFFFLKIFCYQKTLRKELKEKRERKSWETLRMALKVVYV